MWTKVIAIVAVVVGLAAVGGGAAWAWHQQNAVDCCAAGLDCCDPPSGCCLSGGCCNPPQDCCLSEDKAKADCCAAGEECCARGEACCSARAKDCCDK
jgi:hypothetical protein